MESENFRTVGTEIAQQLKEDYLAYSLSVIVGRAIPRVTDGCKPIARRIFTAMKMLNLKPDGRFMKSARLDGEVLGKYSPHGSAYGAIVTLTAPWNNNYSLIDGQGNFGDSTSQFAAARYTEVKSSSLLWEGVLEDSDTWVTTPNYDGSLQEPVELNVKFPLVLLNGQDGIGVGYACKIAPHNLRSIIEATKLVCKETTSEKAFAENLRKAREILLPDFPTGTRVVKDEQLEEYTKTGAGSIRCMAEVEIGVQQRSGKAKDRPTLTFTKLPPGTNPEKIGEQVKNGLEKGRIEGVAEVNDLSDLSGDCVQIVAKPGVNTEKLRDQLYAFTDFDLKFSARTLVIDGIKPVELSPVQIIRRWVPWRLERLRVKFQRELDIKSSRLHIVEGLLKAIDKMDLIIKKIRAAKDKAEAKASLMAAQFKFSDKQAEAILEMRLRQLTNLDQTDLSVEQSELKDRIGELDKLVEGGDSGTKARRDYMLGELTELGKRHGEARRSPLVDPPAAFSTPTPSNRPEATPGTPRPRFMKVDSKKGIVEQVKGPRGALVLDSRDKVILMTDDGFLRKVPSNFKGTITSSYYPVTLAKKESEVSQRKYLVVFEIEGQIRCFVLNGVDLCKATSKGKRWLIEGSRLIHFSEGSYTVDWVSKRKKPLKLDLNQKAGKPASRGVKVAVVGECVT